MTYPVGLPVFSAAGRACRVALGVAALGVAALAFAGCASTNSDTAAPVASGSNVVGPQDTGSYPNLNIPAQQAAPQLSDADSKAKLASLAAQGSAVQRSGGAAPSPKDSLELGQLARNHGKDTLKAIGITCDPTLDPTCK